MDFDLISMKQRAKGLMRNLKISSRMVGIILGIIAFASVVIFFECSGITSTSSIWLFYPLIIEVLYLNFRASAHWYCLKVSREKEIRFSDVVIAFKEKPFKVLVVGILKDISIIIGLFIFILGCILPIYWFRFATYVVHDYDDIGVFGSLIKSMKLLKGHYIELVKIDISNLGWFALAIFTFGIACVYVKPYTTLVYAEFYDYLKGQSELFNN